MVALLAVGSAISLFSCKDQRPLDQESLDRLMTQKTDTLAIFNSQNGKLKYRFAAPLMERYEYARQPYMEFREGIDITTYNDTTMNVESTLRADYALLIEPRELWEAKGNVVATNAQGQILETQQLFWDRKTKRIYSNIDVKVTISPSEVIVGQGFESDEEFKDWEIRRFTGRMEVEVEPTRPQDPLPPGDSPATEAALPEGALVYDEAAGGGAAIPAREGRQAEDPDNEAEEETAPGD